MYPVLLRNFPQKKSFDNVHPVLRFILFPTAVSPPQQLPHSRFLCRDLRLQDAFDDLALPHVVPRVRWYGYYFLKIYWI